MKKSNNCLNMAKGIACFFVVFMHIPFPNTFGIVVKKIGEFAVPLFYMISGFFLCLLELKEVKLGLIKKINRLFNVCLKVSIVYLLWNIFISRFGSGHLAISAFLKRSFTLEHLYKFILFQNTDIFGGRSPYWFLFALLSTYVLLFAVFMLPKWRFIYICIPILLPINFYLHTTDIGWDYYNNLWMTAIPYVLIGIIIAERSFYRGFTPIIFIIVSVISLFITIYGAIVHISCPISITQFTICIFAICIICLALVYPDVSVQFISNIGAKHSMLIYIIHPFVISIIEKLAKALHIDNLSVYHWSSPIIVALISLSLSVISKSINSSKISFYHFLPHVASKASD